ncbi:CUB domain-containing protein [Caerostris extrusa]|uniref:CUB domain-containing protein n=1 Tax=Caerostris extrusa TaxID=172846 RepID=A0AAV4U084_CAEEX|nr:CUB domain-containing protein [Caerostris extrusa]
MLKDYVEDECTSPNKFQKVFFTLPASGPDSVGELRPNRFGTYSRTGRNCLIKMVPPSGYGIIITVLKVDFRNHEGCKDFIKIYDNDEEDEDGDVMRFSIELGVWKDLLF